MKLTHLLTLSENRRAVLALQQQLIDDLPDDVSVEAGDSVTEGGYRALIADNEWLAHQHDKKTN